MPVASEIAGNVDACIRNSSQCLVGVYYFAGWWEPLPNKYAPHGKDWRKDYPGRVPVLGQYNDQPTMDKEIVAAAQFGVDFFQILWYPIDDARNRISLICQPAGIRARGKILAHHLSCPRVGNGGPPWNRF